VTPPAEASPAPSPIVPPIYGTRPRTPDEQPTVLQPPAPTPPVTSEPPTYYGQSASTQSSRQPGVAPSSVSYAHETTVSSRHAGCASCSVGAHDDHSEGAVSLALLGLGAAAVVVRARRRRGRRQRGARPN
jgi:hypothetical protein